MSDDKVVFKQAVTEGQLLPLSDVFSVVPGKKENDVSSSDVSLDLISNSSLTFDDDFDVPGNFERLQKHFDQKLLLLQTHFEAKVNALHEVIRDKDITIGQLNTQIGELKQSCDFLTNETSQLGGKIKANEISVSSAKRQYDELSDKASDLEDRSRRNNVVFFNIEEEADENCDTIVLDLLKSRGFFGADYTLELDRAHRLGKKRPESDNNRPRPIIVRFVFFKDKDLVIKKSKLLKGSDVVVREDYSKLTLQIHKDLRNHALQAKNVMQENPQQMHEIVFFRVLYRRVALTYRKKDNPSSQTFIRNFSLGYINSNRNWFLPPSRQTYDNVQRSISDANR